MHLCPSSWLADSVIICVVIVVLKNSYGGIHYGGVKTQESSMCVWLPYDLSTRIFDLGFYKKSFYFHKQTKN